MDARAAHVTAFDTRPVLRGTFGMVSSTHWLASATGMRMLEAGGNAFDAAVAAGFALQVLEPHFNGPGGECPVICYERSTDRVHVLDGQGAVPQAATLDTFARLGHDRVPGTGPLTSTVPGAVHAWLTLLERFGRLGIEEVLAPAIAYAEQGIPTLPRLHTALRNMQPTFTALWPSSVEAYLTGGVPSVGAPYANPTLARTYTRLVEEGLRAGSQRERRIVAARTAFYEGFVAEAIDAFATRPTIDVAGAPSPLLVTGDDMARHRTAVEAPTTYVQDGLEVCKPGPWSQGPVFLQQLALLDACGFDRYDPTDPECLHTVIEVAKLAFADREAWYGDPRAVDVPLDDLLSGTYARERARLVGEHASTELRPGAPGGRQPRLPAALPATDAPSGNSGAAFGEPVVPDRLHARDTCCVVVVDAEGNAVSAMPSGGWLQSSPAIPGLGFSLGTRAQMTWLEKGLASTLRPGARPRTTLSPTMVRDEHGVRLAFGSPGGDRQDQWALQFFLAWQHGLGGLQGCVDAPHVTTNHFPTSFFPRMARPGDVAVEERVGAAAVDGLRARGHSVSVSKSWSQGRVCVVGVERASGWLVAAADPRGQQAYAAGR